MKEKQVILNGNSVEILDYFKQNLMVDHYEQSATYGLDFEYGKGFLTVFEKYFFRNDSVASLTLHIHPLENEQVEVIIIVSGSESGIFKIDWWIGKSIMKSMDKLIEELR
ncbi:DUF6054 family protein [Carnobacterium sp.]|uniref:DUF6054 family protein n=1 Tax=Carnobacterium sp. TaxID=48221 RepID=UPI00388DBEB3